MLKAANSNVRGGTGGLLRGIDKEVVRIRAIYSFPSFAVFMVKLSETLIAYHFRVPPAGTKYCMNQCYDVSCHFDSAYRVYDNYIMQSVSIISGNNILRLFQ